VRARVHRSHGFLSRELRRRGAARAAPGPTAGHRAAAQGVDPRVVRLQGSVTREPGLRRQLPEEPRARGELGLLEHTERRDAPMGARQFTSPAMTILAFDTRTPKRRTLSSTNVAEPSSTSLLMTSTFCLFGPTELNQTRRPRDVGRGHHVFRSRPGHHLLPRCGGRVPLVARAAREARSRVLRAARAAFPGAHRGYAPAPERPAAARTIDGHRVHAGALADAVRAHPLLHVLFRAAVAGVEDRGAIRAGPERLARDRCGRRDRGALNRPVAEDLAEDRRPAGERAALRRL